MAANDLPVPGPAPSRLIAGRYRLGSRRGAAVEAALFDAVDEQLQRTVVVKLVHPELSARPEVQQAFRTAMALAFELHHPHVAVVHEFGRTEWNGHLVLFTVCEQLKGGSLRDILDRGRSLSPSQAVTFGLDACKGLDALHRAGLVHSDVRPSTLVFGDDRQVRLVDAGLAQVISEAIGGVTARSNDVARYASPEQAVGQPAGPKSDVYSLCLSLLEAVTGSVPFAGDSTVATLANRVDRLLPVSADLGALAAVFERAGRPRPDDRFTAAEFGRALVQAAERLPRPAPLPLLVGSLFGPDIVTPQQPVDPTGPLVRPLPAAEADAVDAVAVDAVAVDAVAVDAVAVDAVELGAATETRAETDTGASPAPELEAVPVSEPAAGPEAVPVPKPAPEPVTLAGATLAAPVGVQPVSTVPPLPPASPAAAPMPSAEPDVDADDEFPERPAGPSSTRRWFLVALLALAALGGGLAWYKSRPVMRTVPDLVGVEQGVALNQIKGDFADIESTVPDEVLAAGLVVRTEPTAGTRVEKGTTVHLFVSSGPAPRILEELKGLTVAEATAKLQAQGLVVEMAKPVFDENVPQDVVISWTVPASPALTVGGTVTKGTTIRLVASGGPAPRTVPNLKGKSLADATAALSGIGLVVAQGPDQFSTTVPPGEVMSQDPAAGKPVPRGGTVTLVLSKGPDLVTVPDLTGLDANGIKTALQNAGFTIGAVNGNPAAQFTGLSVGGKPASAGMKFLRGTKVDLFFNLA